jgi:hypothetical protein
MGQPVPVGAMDEVWLYSGYGTPEPVGAGQEPAVPVPVWWWWWWG